MILYLIRHGKDDDNIRGGWSHHSLTEKGKQVAGEILSKINGILGEMNDGLTEEEREAFYHSLAVISEGLDRVAKYETEENDEVEK